MRKKKKKKPYSTLQFIIILALLGAVAYKYLLPDEHLTENPVQAVDDEQTEQTNPDTTPVEGLEIPATPSKTEGQIIKRKGYTLSYNADYKTPQWVAWELTKSETTGNGERTNKFLPDPDVQGVKAYSSDYTNSGYGRGHMAPAGDMKWSAQAMEESFYMSNICPQNSNLNGGDWNDLEIQSRQWAKKYGAIYIACGPVYDSKSPKRIGYNKVAVPDAFYKVILINDKENPQAIGFIFPNQSGSKPLKKYLVTVDSVEKRTNIDFFPALPDEIENKIEAVLAEELP